MMANTYMIDFDSPDYRLALAALEANIAAARALGYVPPGNFDLALRVMKGELRVPIFSDNGAAGCFGVICSGRDVDEDGMEVFEFWIEQTRKRRENKRACRAVAKIAEAAMSLEPHAALEGPQCTSCGGPRSTHSVAQCRSCYEGARAVLPA